MTNRASCKYIILLTIVLCASAQADWLKVDISTTSQVKGEAPGWTQWLMPIDSGSTQTKTIGSLTFTINMTAPPYEPGVKYLRCQYANKQGQIDQGNFPLSYDGIWPNWESPAGRMPFPNGGSMTLTINGLSEGSHNIVTYHNNMYPASSTWTVNGTTYTNATSDCVVTVDGVHATTITPTVDNRNDATCGYAFFTVDAVAGTPVVISFTPAGNRSMDCVFLNGFEIDAPGEPSAMANTPVPADADMHANCNNDDPGPGQAANGHTTLSWTPSAFAVSHDVYFGTSQTAVQDATRATSSIYKGNQTATTYPVTGLSSKLVYYWRVDEVNNLGVIQKGAVWSFRPRRVVFPGAEGYGRFANAGRYGRIVEVTNLNDSGAGSLRQALEVEKGARIVVFRVSGVINLNSKLIIPSDGGNVYVAGQTAPGDGICVTRYAFGALGANDVVIRFVRLRVGEYSMTAMDGMGLGSCDNSIIDHCSISWSVDEGHSSRNSKNITFQWNMIAEALNDSYHYNGDHAFAATIMGRVGSYHHNLLANCTARNWSIGGYYDSPANYSYDNVRNNVVYNWVHRATDGCPWQIDYVNNYYKPGPSTTYIGLGGNQSDVGPGTWYITGNRIIGYPQYDNDNWAAISNTDAFKALMKVTTPHFGSDLITMTSADQAYIDVTSGAGAIRPKRDRNDSRTVREVLGKTYTFRGSRDSSSMYGIIDSENDAGGYQSLIYRTYNVPADTDHDGLPDWWETMNGLNPNSMAGDYSDSNGDTDNDGYTNLDEYLSYLADGGSQLAYWKCTKSLLADLNGDCQVDFKDLALMAQTWGTLPSISDISNDNVLNNKDIRLFAEDWLSCNREPASECWQ